MSLKRLGASFGALLVAAFCSLSGAPAFAQSAALVEKPYVTGNCATWSATVGNMIKDSGVKCGGGNVQLDAVGIGSMLLTPNAYGFGAPAILNNTVQKPVLLTRSVAPNAQDAGDFECYRNANYTGGTTGFVNPCFYSYTVVQPGTRSFEWSTLVRLDNYGVLADASENTALYAQARKLGTAATFGFVAEIYDQTANPVAGSVTSEFDMSAKGADTNNNRVIMDLFARNSWDTTATESAWGLRLNTDAYTKIKNGIMFNGHYGNGINFVGSTIDSTAITLGDGHALAYDNSQLWKMFYSAGVTYMSVPSLGNVFSWASNGQFSANYVNVANNYLFGGLTSSYPMLGHSGANLEVKKADNSGYAPVIFDYAVSNSGRYCLDITCVRSFWVQGGVTYFNSSSGNVASIADNGQITGSQLVSGTNIILPTGYKICLNGGTCSAYLVWNGSYFQLIGGMLSVGQLSVASSGGLYVDVTPGATCGPAAPTASFKVVKGVVITC